MPGGESTLRLLKYVNDANTHNASELEHRVKQLTLLAKALAGEIESLQAELSPDRSREQIRLDDDGIDFYNEVERYEIELIKSALNHCGGNQTQAARLLRMKSTTLNAKMKHYGLNPVRSLALQHPSHR
jgi:DNA-binding NtrC family response regulator